MTEVYTLQSSEAIARWDEFAPLLARLPEDVTTPISHVRDMVEQAQAQVWCIGEPAECLLITKVENSFDERYGLMWIAAGDMRLMTDMKPIVENWFRDVGCRKACLIGRRGWKKALPDYREQTIQMVKDL
jgi:hypothetical protein